MLGIQGHIHRSSMRRDCAVVCFKGGEVSPNGVWYSPRTPEVIQRILEFWKGLLKEQKHQEMDGEEWGVSGKDGAKREKVGSPLTVSVLHDLIHLSSHV